MLEDQKIESEIKKSLENYEIKTSSQQILNAFSLKSETVEKKPRFSFKKLIPVLTFSCAAVCMFAIVIPFIKNSETQQSINSSLNDSQVINVPFNPNYKQEQTAFSIFSAVNFMNHMEIASPLAKQKISQDDFKEVAQSFDNSFDVINSLFQEQDTYQNEIFNLFETPYVGKYGSYNYLMNLTFDQNTYNFYTEMSFEEEHEDDEIETNTEFKGELIIDENTSYKIVMTIEEELDEKEIETTIYLDDNSLVNIEQEVVDNDEKKYSYTFKKNKKTVYEENLKFNRKHGKKQKCSLEIKNNNEKRIEYKEITPNGNNLNAKYVYKQQYNGEFDLEVNDKNHTYIDKETNLKINL